MRALVLLLLLLLAGAQAAAKTHRMPPVFVPPLKTPPALGAIGAEFSRALVAALKQDGVEVRASASAQAVTLQGQIEEVPPDRLRIRVGCQVQGQASSVQATGDMEHLDGMVQDVVTRLRPLLEPAAAEAPRAQKPPPKKEAAPPRKEAPPKKETAPPRKDGAEPLPPPTPVPDAGTTSAPAPRPPAPAPAPDRPAPPMIEEQPVRVAVATVGEPFRELAPGLYGAGGAAQRSIIAYLQHRLRVVPVPVRLVGLVGGLEALNQSSRVHARYTLMARFDTLGVAAAGSGIPSALTLSGRLHLVLLYDGRLKLDRNLELPPTPFGAGEGARSATSRAVTAALDTIAHDLAAHLGEPR